MLQHRLRLCGYSITKVDFGSAELNDEIHTVSTFAPWNVDEEFKAAFQIVKKHSLIDLYRLYELWELAEQLSKRKGDVVEVGVWRGGSAGLMALQMQSVNDPGKIFCCDTFSGIVNSDSASDKYSDGNLKNTSFELVNSFLQSQVKVNNFVLLKGMFPEETGHLLNTECVKLCHIDVDVLASAQKSVDFIWPKLISGGVIVLDDLGSSMCPGIQAFFLQQRALRDRIVVYNLNGHGLIIKI
jgi:O-methyltransferase